jgi:hypothetical protein
VLLAAGLPLASAGVVEYDIVYVRGPRYGDTQDTRWQEVRDPLSVEPGQDLVLLHPDGREEVLVAGGDGAVVDPVVSFDAQWIYYARFPNVRDREQDLPAAHGVPRAGSDLWKMHITTHEQVQLTHGEWTPSTGTGIWATDPVTPSATHNTVGYRPFNLAPCPLPGNKLMFTSSRDNYLPVRSSTFPNLQLFVLDESTGIVTKVGYLNLGSALHPVVLTDGRVMFSSGEAQGLRDDRVWGLWAIYPDGRQWGPLMSPFTKAAAFHWQTQLSDGRVAVVEYYNLNNWGFGTLLAFASRMPDRPLADRITYFGSPDPRHESNPKVAYGYGDAGKTVRTQRYSFSPLQIESLTRFSHGGDQASHLVGTVRVGKVTHPSAAPNNDVLMVYSPGPVNQQNRPTDKPTVHGQLALLKGGWPVSMPEQLVILKADPAYNVQQPKAVVPYKAIYGLEEPATLPWLPNDGTASPHLPAGTPFGVVGTSTFYKHNVDPWDMKAPGDVSGSAVNWVTQGASVGFTSDEVHSVRIVVMEPVSLRYRGPNNFQRVDRLFLNPSQEKLRVLGEIPLRKWDAEGKPLLDVDGNPDTSFLAKLPADVVFTFQTLDKEGFLLNASQTWHQLRPGEVRTDCGGCHAHAQVGTEFARTAAAQPAYQVHDLTQTVPQDVEYGQVRPLLERYAPELATLKPGELIAQKMTPEEQQKPVLPFRSKRSGIVQRLTSAGAPPDDIRLVARWVDLGATVNLNATHGYFLRETRPTLTLTVMPGPVPAPVSCPPGCAPIAAVAVVRPSVRVGYTSVYQDLVPDSLELTHPSQPGVNLASQCQPESPGVCVLPAPGPGVLTARVRDASGNEQTAQVALR